MEENSRENLAWKAVRTEHLVDDEYIDFRRMDYELPDGTVFGPFYNYSRRNYVVIAATDEKGNFLCVRQFRHGIGEVTTEFPAGGIEGKDGSGSEPGEKRPSLETALATAKRELKEETGCESDDWEHLLTIPSNATLADNYAYLFRAGGCRRTGSQHLDETEFLNVVTVSPDELEELIRKEQFQQAIHVLAFELAKKKKPGL